jgi:hypothetical protein
VSVCVLTIDQIRRVSRKINKKGGAGRYSIDVAAVVDAAEKDDKVCCCCCCSFFVLVFLLFDLQVFAAALKEVAEEGELTPTTEAKVGVPVDCRASHAS